MIVLVDIGNTRTKYCLVNEGKRSVPQAILNDQLLTELLGTSLLTVNLLGINFSKATKILVASVSCNQLTDEINTWCKKNNVAFQQVVSEAQKNEVKTGYKQPAQLGVDRWLALIGAAALFPQHNSLIIDAGTATTVDLLAANGQHQGGWILGGINTLITSVLTQTSQVQANNSEKESLAFGGNSSENVHNAAWAATVGTVNLAVFQAQQQGFEVEQIIFTGGNGTLLSSFITPYITQEKTVIDDLVFVGLQAYI